MTEDFALSPTNEADKELTQVGPLLRNLPHQLTVPKEMVRKVIYGQDAPEVFIRVSFLGERLEVTELKVVASREPVSTQFLTKLTLPKVLRAIAVESTPHASNWLLAGNYETSLPNYEFLAQLYWFEYMSWGSPRSRIMEHMGWSRANTNWHLRKIARRCNLPRPHLASND
jgi:hypothetical protein